MVTECLRDRVTPLAVKSGQSRLGDGAEMCRLPDQLEPTTCRCPCLSIAEKRVNEWLKCKGF